MGRKTADLLQAGGMVAGLPIVENSGFRVIEWVQVFKGSSAFYLTGYPSPTILPCYSDFHRNLFAMKGIVP
jgi:hypothetical protein